MSNFVTYPPNNIVPLTCDSGQVSDGYHTFDELYAHRCHLFAWLCSLQPGHAFKTRLNDKGEAWPGWFIAGINTPHGQITYHLPDALWEGVRVQEIERNTGYDGHTSADVLERIFKILHIGDGYDPFTNTTAEQRRARPKTGAISYSSHAG